MAKAERALGDAPALPLAHRLALLYLAAPLGVWLLGWFVWWVGVPLAGLLALALWQALRPQRGGKAKQHARRPSFSRVGLALALAMLVWVLLFPVGGLFTPQGQDWVAHRAVFLDLGRGDWPTYLTEFVNRPQPLLRYHLGYYMVPGLLGKWLGAAALNYLVPLWTCAGATLLAWLFARGLPQLRAALLAAVVGLALFSGVDVLQYILREGPVDGVARYWERVSNRLSPVFLITRESPMLLDYLSNALQFRNTPHHFVAAGLGTMLLLQLRRQPRFLAVVGVMLVTSAFWTATATAGLGALAVGLLFGGGARRLASWQNFVAAPVFGGVVGLYFASGAVDFPHGWLWNLYDDVWRMVADVSVLYVCEFLLLAALVWRLRPRLGRDPVCLAALAVLLAAPWYWYGDYDFSELTLRVVIPPLFVLAYHAARIVAAGLFPLASPGGGTRRRRVPRRWAFPALLALLSAGALSALAEFATVLRRPGWLPFEETRTTLALASVKDADQRLARSPPALLRALLRRSENKGGPKGELVLRGHYNLYQRGNLLVYARAACDVDFERTTRFFLRSEGRRREFGMRPAHLRRGHPCVLGHRLPAWAMVGRVRLGQLVPGEGVVWEAEVGIGDENRGEWQVLRHSRGFFRARYESLRSAAVDEPAMRSHFDVHIAGEDLIFTRAQCAPADTAAKFILHAFPIHRGALPPHRRAAGFDNLDFRFGERGAFAEGGCATAASLPSYLLARVRVGQWHETRQQVLWGVDIPFDPAR